MPPYIVFFFPVDNILCYRFIGENCPNDNFKKLWQKCSWATWHILNNVFSFHLFISCTLDSLLYIKLLPLWKHLENTYYKTKTVPWHIKHTAFRRGAFKREWVGTQQTKTSHQCKHNLYFFQQNQKSPHHPPPTFTLWVFWSAKCPQRGPGQFGHPIPIPRRTHGIPSRETGKQCQPLASRS